MNLSVNGQSQVPPGFRFHPTEEELLQYYLRKKVAYEKIDLDVIRDIDLNKLEPWDIQERCRIGSGPQNDWYFFSHKDKKYPTGTRTNRATAAGFWKATGRDKVIHGGVRRIGMRKTLVFYKGRAPHGQKSDWIMHEYRLDETAQDSNNLIQANNMAGESVPEEGWVVCRVFKKKNYHKALDCPQNSSSPDSLDSRTLKKIMPSDDAVLDQILTYMGRSSTCKQESEANNNGINFPPPIAAVDRAPIHDGLHRHFAHLPALQCFPTAHHNGPPSFCGLKPSHESSIVDEISIVETSEPSWTKQDCHGLNDWTKVDRLVASQLNGQFDSSRQFNHEHPDNLYFSMDHHDHGINDSDRDQQLVYGSDIDLWSFVRSSSSSDPLCHLPV